MNDQHSTEPPELEQFFIIFLRRPENPPLMSDEALMALQGEHLAHLRKMSEMGILLIAGPIADPSEKLRGISICRGESLEAVRAIAEDDPAVKAGRLEIEVMPWYAPKGRLKIDTTDF